MNDTIPNMIVTLNKIDQTSCSGIIYSVKRKYSNLLEPSGHYAAEVPPSNTQNNKVSLSAHLYFKCNWSDLSRCKRCPSTVEWIYQASEQSLKISSGLNQDSSLKLSLREYLEVNCTAATPCTSEHKVPPVTRQWVTNGRFMDRILNSSFSFDSSKYRTQEVNPVAQAAINFGYYTY